jgi:hypothetical protein
MRTAVAIAAAAFLAVAPAAAAKPKPCSLAGSKTVAASKSARVYSIKNKQGARTLVGCLRSNNKRQTLERGYDDGLYLSGAFSRVRLAGRFVAWQLTEYDLSCKEMCPEGYNPNVHLKIHDLRKRKTKTVPGDNEVASKGRLVLTTGGSIAWTQQGSTDDEVDAFDKAGRRQLDHGNIPPGSLTLSGKVASWTKDGATQSATLAPRG